MSKQVKANPTYQQPTEKKSRKEIIFDEAARLFKEKGYQATSMRDLAHSVQLEPSSLYSHIKSKDELLKKICFDCAKHFTTAMSEVQNEQIPPLQKIRKLIELHIQITLKEPTSVTVFNDEWKNLPMKELVIFRRMRKKYENEFIDIMNAAKEEGEMIDAAPEILLNTIISAVRWIQPGNSYTDKWPSHEITSVITAFIMGGLTNQKS
jgi:AcrR family transcriptional regulator